MPLPFYIECDEPAVGLYQLKDGRFQLIQDGPISPFMAGHGYLLVETKLAEFLQTLGLERVSFSPAVIWHRARGLETHDHVNLRVGQVFSYHQVRDLNLEGDSLLTMADQYYFASPLLRERLEAAGFAYLRFSEGLSNFAA